MKLVWQLHCSDCCYLLLRQLKEKEKEKEKEMEMERRREQLTIPNESAVPSLKYQVPYAEIR